MFYLTEAAGLDYVHIAAIPEASAHHLLYILELHAEVFFDEDVLVRAPVQDLLRP